VFIEDVNEAYVQVVEHAKEGIGAIVNIGAGRQFTVGEVVREIITLTGAAVTPLWGCVPNPRVEPAVWRADIAKAERVLGWRPRHALTQGLKKSIHWFTRNLSLYEKSAA
jgi:nucleoside-diphosphate-sugar epimerase